MIQSLHAPISPGTRRKSDSKDALESPRMRVLNWIERSIAKGELSPGDPIPSERALAERLGVARNTAAAAIDEAERRHLVVRRNASARKRFVPPVGSETALSSSTVFVMGAMDPYVHGGPAPRWSDRYLSVVLPPLLSRTGKHVMLLNGDSLAESDVDGLFRTPPAGMIITNAISGDPLAMRALEHCREAAVPVVVYGNAPALAGFDRVYTDHRAGGRAVTEWLLSQGRRRIVPLLPQEPSTHWARERMEGYAEAMRAAGLSPAPIAVYGDNGVDEMPSAEKFRVYRALALSTLLDLRAHGDFDAIVCLTDHWARPVIAALRALGLDPFRDVLVSGYDNIDRDEDFDDYETEGPVVTIDKHNEKTAEEMADLLVARMEGRLPPEPQVRTHAHELVVRKRRRHA